MQTCFDCYKVDQVTDTASDQKLDQPRQIHFGREGKARVEDKTQYNASDIPGSIRRVNAKAKIGQHQNNDSSQ